MTATTCPRRMTDPIGTWERAEGLDSETDGTCSFCGSLTADRFMERVKAGDSLDPTDKPYKVYLDRPHAKFYFQHLSVEQQHEFIDLLNERPRRVAIGYPGRFCVLPFFITTDGATP